MHRTEGTNNAANLFTDGPPGTTVEENWLNAIQEEIIAVLTAVGISPLTAATDTRDQLVNALGFGRYVDYEETDQGVVGNGKTIKAYVDAIGTNKATLILRHNSGGITTTYTLTTTETIPSNITLKMEHGAILSGVGTLLIKSFQAGLYQVFSGTGPISLYGTAPVSAEWFGVSKDETAANNDIYIARAFASHHHVKLTKPGSYDFDTIVVPTWQNFEIGKEVIINKSSSSTSTYAFDITGTKGTDTTTLSANTTMGANSITVVDASWFPAGTFFYLEDDEWDGIANVYKHEINVVDARVGNVLKLRYPTCNLYKTTENATITKIDTIKEKIHIFGEGKITTSLGTASYGIYMEYCAQVKITDLEVRGFYNDHISMRYSVDCLVENNDIGDGIAFASGQGYGIALAKGSSHSSVINNRLRKLRHCLVAGGGTSFNLWTENHLHGYHTHALDGIDLHGSYVHHDRYTDNYIAGMKQDGIWCADPFNEFVGNTIVGCERYGICLTKYIHDGITGIAQACVVTNNTIRHYASNRAIHLQSYDSGDDTDTIILNDLLIQNNNISLHAAAGQANVCGIYGRGLSGLIEGNKIRYENPAQTDSSSRAIDISEWEATGNFGLIKNLKISDNHVYGGYYAAMMKGKADALEIGNNRFEEQYHTGIYLLGRSGGNELEGTLVKNNHIVHSGNLTNGVMTNECNNTSIVGTEFFIGGTLANMIKETANTEKTTILGTKCHGTVTTPFTWTDKTGCRGEQAVVKMGTIAGGTDDERPIWIADGHNGAAVTDILLVNAVDITQHDTDYETFTIYDRAPNGAGGNVVVSCTTKATGGVDFNDFDPASMGSVSDTHGLLERDTAISFDKTHSGAGQGTDEMIVIVRYVTY